MDEAQHFGKRVAKARGRMSQKDLAAHAGVSESTIKRIEKTGKAKSAQRKGLALVLIEEAGAPPELFSEELGSLLSREQVEADALAEIRQMIGALATLATVPDLGDAARQLLEGELAAARRWSANDRSSGELESEAQNG
jgi:transcriptional regulator with XRE-family HTH domain